MSTYYEDCVSLTTKFLRVNGFLKPNRVSHCDLEFISNNEPYKLKVVATTMEEPQLILQYGYKNKTFRTYVDLIPRYNNLGGVGYKFKCPQTGKGCYNLYFVDGVVASRNHFKLIYRSQIKSQREKDMEKKYAAKFKAEEAREEINSYRFKKFHNGKMTKKYRRCLKTIMKAEEIS